MHNPFAVQIAQDLEHVPNKLQDHRDWEVLSVEDAPERPVVLFQDHVNRVFCFESAPEAANPWVLAGRENLPLLVKGQLALASLPCKVSRLLECFDRHHFLCPSLDTFQDSGARTGS